MKITGQKGEYFYKALVEFPDGRGGWFLTSEYFQTENEAIFKYNVARCKWPADCIAEGVVYIPSEEESKCE